MSKLVRGVFTLPILVRKNVKMVKSFPILAMPAWKLKMERFLQCLMY